MLGRKSRITAVVSAASLVGIVTALAAGSLGVAEGATGGPWVKVGSHGTPVNIGTISTNVAALPLPAGKYLVSAKLVLISNPSTTRVTCHLQIGGQGDDSQTNPTTDGAPLSLTAAGTLNSPGSATLACTQSSSAGSIAARVKITAVRAGTLTNVEI